MAIVDSGRYREQAASAVTQGTENNMCTNKKGHELRHVLE